MTALTTLYGSRFPTTVHTLSAESDKAWLSNDICRFLNNDKPTMFGYVKFYKSVFQRLFMNQTKDHSMVTIPVLIGDLKFNDIKVSIGLLLPSERRQLELFLNDIGGVEV
jgi:hypothetical protein